MKSNYVSRIATAMLAVLCAGCLSKEEESAADNGPRQVSGAPATRAEAAAFLAQATFGGTPAEIDRLMQIGYHAWFEEQRARQPSRSHVATMLSPPVPPRTGNAIDQFTMVQSWWHQAVTGEDALRQRAAFAWSQLFVASMTSQYWDHAPYRWAHLQDTFATHAFSPYKQLATHVTLSPGMGYYLNMMGNTKETRDAMGKLVQTPNQNYARELLQLFSLGLVQRDITGKVKVGADNVPLPAYTQQDIEGLARVFTGYSWAYPGQTRSAAAEARFSGADVAPHFTGDTGNDPYNTRPMSFYPQHHSTEEKKFFGVTIPKNISDPESEMSAVFDAIIAQETFCPNIALRTIKTFTTSNPSPAYVQRVAEECMRDAEGTRGNMFAILKQTLLDPEARGVGRAVAHCGKVREPLVRAVHWARAFGAKSVSGAWFVTLPSESGAIEIEDAPALGLGQTPLRPPSVFGWFPPDYAPEGSAVRAANLVAPEMALVHHASIVGYARFMHQAVFNGFGGDRHGRRPTPDVVAAYEDLVPLADDPARLTDEVLVRLGMRNVPEATRAQLVTVANGIAIPTKAEDARAARLQRIKNVILLSALSPDYIVQSCR